MEWQPSHPNRVIVHFCRANSPLCIVECIFTLWRVKGKSDTIPSAHRNAVIPNIHSFGVKIHSDLERNTHSYGFERLYFHLRLERKYFPLQEIWRVTLHHGVLEVLKKPRACNFSLRIPRACAHACDAELVDTRPRRFNQSELIQRGCGRERKQRKEGEIVKLRA